MRRDYAPSNPDLAEVLRFAGLERSAHPIRLASGAWTYDFVDAKRAVSSGRNLRLAADSVIAAVHGHGIMFEAVGGLASGANALAVAVAERDDKYWFIVDKDSTLPSQQRIHGHSLATGERVLIVDDVVTTGAALLETHRVISDLAATPVGAAVLCDRGDHAALKLSNLSLPFFPMVTYSDIGIASVLPVDDVSVATGHRFLEAIRDSRIFPLIAEIKRKSPSAGDLLLGLDVRQMAQTYEQAGATCLSVLTESDRFGGSADDLKTAKKATGLPVLRKDFLRTAEDVYESAEMGADAILVILKDLERYSDFRVLQELAASLEIDVIAEIRNTNELASAIRHGAQAIAVNQRNAPKSAAVTLDHDAAVRLAPVLRSRGQGIVAIAASGIATPDGTPLHRIVEAGYHAALIGEAFLRASDPQQAVQELVGPQPGLPQRSSS